MYIIGGNDAGFEWVCEDVYSAEQAIGYAKQQYGVRIRIRDIRAID
jgi:hypothetical protein